MMDDVGEGKVSRESTLWMAYCLLGTKHHLPNVGAHYEKPDDADLSACYQRYVKRYFSGRE